jgi:TolB-like protein/Tfp pilus assembly protein PilF
MQEEPSTQPNTATGAIFLSYASGDGEAARRICDALRAAGIEVWFDQSELRGGDAWDRQIRQHIHDCALFVPVISAQSEARHEGYFRREWRLAVERAGDMSGRVAFLVPVVIDDTSDLRADVPERFREVQWTRLPGGETPAAFVERIRRLLAREAVTAIDAAARAGSESPSAIRPSRTAPWSRRILPMAGAVLVLGALAYIAIDKPWISKPAATPVVAQPAASIAVLPLTNESVEASQQYFSDGISEDLITALGQFPGLKVIGRISSFQFRNSKEDSRSIGAKLGVAHLLEGSVRKSGDTIRVSAELIDTSDGSMQWSEQYDRRYQDLFALQDEITHAVVSALRSKLLPGEYALAQNDRPPSGSLEAYNALLEGRFSYSRGTEADLRKGVEFFTQATQLDSHYALAWSGLSQSFSTLAARFLQGAAIQDARANARAAAERALSLLPELAAAHVARGTALLLELDWRGAEEEYRRALVLVPADADAQVSFARLQAAFGEPERAVELTRQALATEPLQANWYGWLASYLCGLDRLDEAERTIRKAIELQPSAAVNHQRLAIIEVQRGNAQAALAAAQQEPAGLWQASALALATQIGSDRSAADAALGTMIDKYAGNLAYQIAEVYALRNDAQKTFEWLDRAWNIKDVGVVYLLFDPLMLRFRDDPRFSAFCRKAGLPVPRDARQQT